MHCPQHPGSARGAGELRRPPGAVDYNVRRGLAGNRLLQTCQRFADRPIQLTRTSLDKGTRQAVAVEAFDEHGVSGLSKEVVLDP